jgi:hypothetical protein
VKQKLLSSEFISRLWWKENMDLNIVYNILKVIECWVSWNFLSYASLMSKIPFLTILITINKHQKTNKHLHNNKKDPSLC